MIFFSTKYSLKYQEPHKLWKIAPNSKNQFIKDKVFSHNANLKDCVLDIGERTVLPHKILIGSHTLL